MIRKVQIILLSFRLSTVVRIWDDALQGQEEVLELAITKWPEVDATELRLNLVGEGCGAIAG
jgi:hypothetical protein